jgi:hypothetical protein
MYCKVYINYRGARQIVWFMFQTLLRRSALAAVSSAVWVRDKAAKVIGVQKGSKAASHYRQKMHQSFIQLFYAFELGCILESIVETINSLKQRIAFAARKSCG